MPDMKPLPGKFVWFEHVSRDPKKAQAFYGEVLGWKATPFSMGDSSYDMIYVGDTMIGGYDQPRGNQPAHWISYVSVDDVDAAAKAATANGGKIVAPPSDIPTVGRMARIADPQGAELCLFKRVNGDPPDATTAPPGTFFWNELHTPDPAKTLGFYDKVVGYSHRAMDMGAAGSYYILARGGVDRAGATSHMGGGPASWLPYVSVTDPDAVLARAKKQGATIQIDASDIPGVGRFGVLQDPTGAVLAIMKPQPATPKPTK